MDADERGALAIALIDCIAGLGSEWLPRVEAAVASHGNEAAIVAAAGMVFAERQLWGKARRPLEQTAHTATLPGPRAPPGAAPARVHRPARGRRGAGRRLRAPGAP